jgi:S1-C subfamily serine protease
MTIPALGIVVVTRANYGVEITGVARGSVAEKAGLQAGNIITQIDRVRVWTAADLAAALLNRPPSSPVAVGYVFMSTALGYMPKEIFFNLERAH